MVCRSTVRLPAAYDLVRDVCVFPAAQPPRSANPTTSARVRSHIHHIDLASLSLPQRCFGSLLAVLFVTSD